MFKYSKEIQIFHAIGTDASRDLLKQNIIESNMKHLLELAFSSSILQYNRFKFYNCSLSPLVRPNLPDTLSTNPSWKLPCIGPLLTSCCFGGVSFIFFLSSSDTDIVAYQCAVPIKQSKHIWVLNTYLLLVGFITQNYPAHSGTVV